MRLALAATLLAACGGSREPERVYISIGTDAVAQVMTLAVHEGAPAKLLETGDDIAVLAVEPNELEGISQLMHEQFGRCSGFLVHDSLADAQASLHPAAAPAIDYTIDHEPVVHAVLPALDRNTIKGTIAELSAMPNRYYRSESGAQASL